MGSSRSHCSILYRRHLCCHTGAHGLAELGSLRLGQQARVRIDSFPGRDFAGTITWISPVAEFTPRDIQTKDERVKLVFAVRIEIANRDGVFKPGMPADALVREAGGR